MSGLMSEIGGSGHPRVEEKLQYPATHSNYQHHEDWRDTSNIQSNEAFDSPAKDVWMPRGNPKITRTALSLRTEMSITRAEHTYFIGRSQKPHIRHNFKELDTK